MPGSGPLTTVEGSPWHPQRSARRRHADLRCERLDGHQQSFPCSRLNPSSPATFPWTSRIVWAVCSSFSIVGVQGRAGTGKTTMLRQVRELAGDRQVIGLAPSAAAARVLERESDIHARTLQWFLTRCQAVGGNGSAVGDLRKLFGGSVLVLDEASMVSTDQMRSLTRIAAELDVARLVLVGDTSQLRAVDAGQPFRQLQQAGMTTARMDDILRQRNPELRAAVLAALAGEPGEAVELLGSSVHEVAYDELGEKAAQTWLELDPEVRDRTLLLAPTHALRAEINRTLRGALREEGMLRGKALVIERLVSLGMTRAEKGDVRNYREDDMIVFHQDMVNYRVKKDEALTVEVLWRSDEEPCVPMDMSLALLTAGGLWRAFWDDEEERESEAREQKEELEESRELLHRPGPHMSMKIG